MNLEVDIDLRNKDLLNTFKPKIRHYSDILGSSNVSEVNLQVVETVEPLLQMGW